MHVIWRITFRGRTAELDQAQCVLQLGTPALAPTKFWCMSMSAACHSYPLAALGQPQTQGSSEKDLHKPHLLIWHTWALLAASCWASCTTSFSSCTAARVAAVQATPAKAAAMSSTQAPPRSRRHCPVQSCISCASGMNS